MEAATMRGNRPQSPASMNMFAQVRLVPSPKGWLQAADEPAFVERRRQQRREDREATAVDRPRADRRLGPGRRLEDWRHTATE
jgi:hypothetical protein